MRPALVLVCATLAVGCGSSGVTPARSAPSSETRIAALEAQVLSLRRQSAVDKVEIGRLRQQIAELSGALDVAQSQATRTADEARAREAVRHAAPPRIEEDDLEEETVPVASSPTSRRAPPTPAPTVAPPATATISSVSEDGQDVYDRGYTLFHQQRYKEAEGQFQRFLEGDATTDLSDNAQYWIGECRFALGDHAGALAAFTTTVERYPHGNKIPDAMVKAGKSLERLGDRESAEQTYQEVVSRFSGTAAAAQASERLAALRE